MHDGSFSSGSEPCLLAPSLLRDMQVLAENAEKSSQLTIFTICVKPYAFWLIPAAELKVHVPMQSAQVVPKVYVQAYRLFCVFRLIRTAKAEEERWVCMCVSTANWIMTAER